MEHAASRRTGGRPVATATGHAGSAPRRPPGGETEARMDGAAYADRQADLAGPPPGEGRSARKRRAIMAAARTLFLRNGYQGTSMDEIAALAAVSKQTVYKNFADKEQLFTDIVLNTLDQVGIPLLAEIGKLQGTENLGEDLRDLARGYLASVMQPQVLQLRRLIIGEANRLPGLAHLYYERAPERTLNALAGCFAHLAERGLLRVADPLLAACHFAFLVLGRALDKALFHGEQEIFSAAELREFADAGARVFLSAYGQS
jgi:TetR/AcrR family transcriptional regulator, mexJK operon transcriptional repressor